MSWQTVMQAKQGAGQIDNKTLQRLADAVVAEGSALDLEVEKSAGRMIKVLTSSTFILTPTLQQQVISTWHVIVP